MAPCAQYVPVGLNGVGGATRLERRRISGTKERDYMKPLVFSLSDYHLDLSTKETLAPNSSSLILVFIYPHHEPHKVVRCC